MKLTYHTDSESMTPAEDTARARRMAPGPFQDAVARMFIHSEVSAWSTAQFFNIGLKEVNAMVTWVAETNLRRLMNTPAPWDKL